MSTTTDALDSWFSELAGGESSMRRLRKRLGVDSSSDPGSCPTCQRPYAEDVDPAAAPTD